MLNSTNEWQKRSIKCKTFFLIKADHLICERWKCVKLAFLWDQKWIFVEFGELNMKNAPTERGNGMDFKITRVSNWPF